MPQAKTKLTLQDRFRIGVKIAFYFSGCLTVASLFTSFTPSFVKCFVTTIVLMLVKSSADQMAESQ